MEQSYLIADNYGNILVEENSDVKRPIASISKLMIGILAANQSQDEQLDIPVKRTVQSVIPRGRQQLSRKELMTLALVRSDNFAAQILCSNIPECVDKMNSKAQELGMLDTHFVEPTGLSKENVSTANDLLKLMIEAAHYKPITEMSSMPKAEIPIGNSTIRVNNTNPLTQKLNIVLSKTGFTNPAGQCLVMLVSSPIGQRFMILLGSNNRIAEMEKLYKKFVVTN